MSSHLAILDLLRRAEVEVEIIGKISDGLKERMFAARTLRETWVLVEKVLREYVAKEDLAQKERAEFESKIPGSNPLPPANLDRSKKFLLDTVHLTMSDFKRRIEQMVGGGAKGAYDNVAVANAQALDRFLRADAAAERSLNQAAERLERLQRCRKGEPVPAPVSIRLTR
jgi:hypothetical protein